MTEYKADQIIRHLEMQPHREGGWYRFMWRHEKMTAKSTLGDAYTGERALCSLIYYLLWGEEISRWHQLKSPEIWTWHCGDSLIMTLGGAGGTPEQEQQIRIGNRLDQGDAFQFVVPGEYGRRQGWIQRGSMDLPWCPASYLRPFWRRTAICRSLYFSRKRRGTYV